MKRSQTGFSSTRLRIEVGWGSDFISGVRISERRKEMKRNFLMLLCLGVVLILPNLVVADCADIGGFSSFCVSGSTVTLYSGGTPYARFDVQCTIYPTSKLQLTKGYVCDGDEVLVDGFTCTIMNVSSSIN